MNLLAVVVIMALVALTGSLLYVARALPPSVSTPEPVPDRFVTPSMLHEITQLAEKNAAQIDDLRLAVSDGIQRSDRAEKRVQKTVSAARRLVRENGLEHAGLEAEHEELLERDDAPSGVSEVLPLFKPVETPPPTGIPGMNPQELARIREIMNA